MDIWTNPVGIAHIPTGPATITGSVNNEKIFTTRVKKPDN